MKIIKKNITMKQKNKEIKLGLYLVLFGWVFSIIETVYFGNNFLPQSGAETIADIISFGMIFTGIYFILKKSKQRS